MDLDLTGEPLSALDTLSAPAEGEDVTDETAAPQYDPEEITVYVAEDGVLCVGDRSVVDTYIAALQRTAGQSLSDLGIGRQSLLDVAAAASALEALHATGGEYFQMSPSSLELFKDLGVIPGAGGYFKGTVRSDTGQFFANLDFRQVSLGPTRAMSIQLAFATASLRAAIKDVERAVERVESKVDDLAARVHSATLGEVLGSHRLLGQHVATLDETGVLPETIWQSVAALGPQLVVGIERLRQFLSQRVKNLDVAKSAAERAKQLHDAVDNNSIGEVLQLLVVTEDSHYLWHRLSIEHARTTEPHNLEHVIASARKLLRDDVQLDRELLDDIRQAIDFYATLRPLEKHRMLSRRKLEEDVETLRRGFDDFAAARQMQVTSWQAIQRPTWGDVGAELGRRGTALGLAAQNASTKAIDAADGYATRAAGAIAEQARAAGDAIDLQAHRAADAAKDAWPKKPSQDAND
ncbi:hypothetical protein [Pseudofrankia sp. BMG5.36]|uniref:hypothetical protein n=1 Tax=Pseudofrankia sp. BMG5.36 TaxID=1834512 RepID=UPI0008DA08A0|nr:hypothetical protein [Pseudofrankia sp. BMG5.36]OHV64186.1 hypothetical protein BCD48_37690 [Pseudofrankia sp. BMG5.36]